MKQILQKLTSKSIAMSGDRWVYLDTKKPVEKKFLLLAKKEAQVQKIQNKKIEFTEALDTFIQAQIDEYNAKKGTVLENVQSCALYASYPKERHHTPFTKWIWGWKDDIFEFAEIEFGKVQEGKREMPASKEELLAEILEKYPLKTQEFIGE